ncbi:MAG TPA: orotidine-5'-phosphate decarboxylase [Solirubrobacteraceae bacterium]|jgi:orotidine-5'-phosphate decarboxylase|nr:orotidine-5'-phosphate decarboxylase [Solirubrobacteraceae bacterium]
MTAGSSTFADTLAARVAERESQVVLGLDPDPDGLWPQAHSDVHHRHTDASHALRTAIAVRVHCCALIDAVGPACVAVKPQLACFERLGAHGWETLDAVCAHARSRGLLVIADGKRGDIAVSARAYAEALYERLGVDLATVNPLLGRDALAPFIETARARGAGVLVLVRTSNPGAADVQDLRLDSGETVWERLAVLVAELGASPARAAGGGVGVGGCERGAAAAAVDASGGREGGAGASRLSDLGAVMGATQPQHLERARELMPRAVLLLPGVGVQGGRVEDLAAAFAPGRAGGLITASRSIAGAHLAAGGDPAEAARAEAERLRAAAWSLSV